MSLRFKSPQEQEAIFIGLHQPEEKAKLIAFLQNTKGKRDLIVSIATFLEPQQRILFCPPYFLDGFYVKLVLDSGNSEDYLSCFAPLDTFINLFATVIPQALQNDNHFEDDRVEFRINHFETSVDTVAKAEVFGSEAVKCC